MNNSLLADPHQKKLLKRWEKILESGTPIQSESTKVALAQILENTYSYYQMKGMLNEAGVVRGGVAQQDIVGQKQNGVLRGDDGYKAVRPGYAEEGYGDYYLPNVVMPMLRRIMPDLLANELVAVQPLNGPVGFALAYRPLYGENGSMTHGKKSDREIGYNPVDTTWTGLTGEVPQKDAAGKAITEMLSAYTDDPSWYGQPAPIGRQSEYLTLDDDYPTVTFGLLKSTVEARTRKLAAHWSPELAEDMQTMHGIDVEREMVNTLTYEVGAEIDRQIVTDMVKAAIIGGSTSKWSPLSADGLDQMGRLATLLTQITIEAQQIAIRTKRGNANFLITTPRVCALLQQMGMNKFASFKNGASMPSVPDTGVGALAKIGLINDDSMLLIRDAHVQAKDSDYVLMGYKGKQAGDSGIIYCPYIPLQLARVTQPGSFTPSVGARTRYGIMNNPWDAKNYYTYMKIEGCTSEYTWNGSRHFIGETSPLMTLPPNAGAPVMPMTTR